MEHIVLKTGHVCPGLKMKILESYRDSGAACVHSIGEDFSFVLTDIRNRVFIAKRGAFSSVPVYGHYLEGRHVVCNFLLKELLPFVKFPLRPCEKKIKEYFSFSGEIAGNLTFYRDIFRLLPGEYLVKEQEKDCTSGFVRITGFPENGRGRESEVNVGNPERPVKESGIMPEMADPLEEIRRKIRVTIQPEMPDGFPDFNVLFERFKTSCGRDYLRHPVWDYCNRAVFEQAVQDVTDRTPEQGSTFEKTGLRLYRVVCLALWLEYVNDLNRRVGRLRAVSEK